MSASSDKPSRRSLRFHDLDQVVQDAESLMEGGYVRAGRWDLAQTCGHVADWMRFPLEGFPTPPRTMRLILWLIRTTSGRRLLRRVLASQTMPAGNPTLPETVPPAGGDERQAVERLRQVVARFRAHGGPLHPSPVFGAMDRETLTRLQLVHCAHHFSFLIPQADSQR